MDRDALIQMMLAGLAREYPHVAPSFLDANDFRPTRERNPIFYGCYDWHSAVHTHWALLRLGAQSVRARFTPEAVAAEAAFLAHPARRGFEMPYGLAWLLQLCAEAPSELRPLEDVAAQRFLDWLPNLSHPSRSGEHSQTAFALGLVWDWSHETHPLRAAVEQAARRFYLADRTAALSQEPSAYDFLSPALAEADLMRRVLPAREWLPWLDVFLPDFSLEPVVPVNRTEGKFVHFDGLNLSRAWMLQDIASALADGNPRKKRWQTLAYRHGEAGMGSLTEQGWAGSHWLGSFAVRWLQGSR